MWTLFEDTYSGGSPKGVWNSIYIEAPRKEAEIIFYNRFGHDPNKITHPGYGKDYRIIELEYLPKKQIYKLLEREFELIIPHDFNIRLIGKFVKKI